MRLWDRITGKSAVDFSQADSREKAQALCQQGKLVRIHVFPLEFGGLDGEMNVACVTARAAQEKASIDAEISKLLQAGADLRYRADPKYKGNSFVPSELVVSVSGSRTFQRSVAVW